MNRIALKTIPFAGALLSAIFILTGCSRQAVLFITPSNTPKAFSTQPQTETPQVETSLTYTPTITPSFTPSATWTPLPTLSAEQAKKTINELLSNNGDCQIPCWWGIVPSQTPWLEAMQFLAQFSEIKQGGSSSYQENGKVHYTTNYSIYYKNLGENESADLIIGVQDDIVIGFSVFPSDTVRNFQLHQVLALLGKPNQVYVSTQPDTQTNVLLPAIVILDYGKIGVIASYEFPLRKVGEDLKICPKSVGARLELKNPKAEYHYDLSIEEYVSMITGFEPKNLESISEMSIEAFYEAFQTPNSVFCIETPISLWP